MVYDLWYMVYDVWFMCVIIYCRVKGVEIVHKANQKTTLRTKKLKKKTPQKTMKIYVGHLVIVL